MLLPTGDTYKIIQTIDLSNVSSRVLDTSSTGPTSLGSHIAHTGACDVSESSAAPTRERFTIHGESQHGHSFLSPDPRLQNNHDLLMRR